MERYFNPNTFCSSETLFNIFSFIVAGVSAHSFIHAFTLTHSVFNVQFATPQVRIVPRAPLMYFNDQRVHRIFLRFKIFAKKGFVLGP